MASPLSALRGDTVVSLPPPSPSALAAAALADEAARRLARVTALLANAATAAQGMAAAAAWHAAAPVAAVAAVPYLILACDTLLRAAGDGPPPPGSSGGGGGDGDAAPAAASATLATARGLVERCCVSPGLPASDLDRCTPWVDLVLGVVDVVRRPGLAPAAKVRALGAEFLPTSLCLGLVPPASACMHGWAGSCVPGASAGLRGPGLAHGGRGAARGRRRGHPPSPGHRGRPARLC